MTIENETENFVLLTWNFSPKNIGYCCQLVSANPAAVLGTFHHRYIVNCSLTFPLFWWNFVGFLYKERNRESNSVKNRKYFASWVKCILHWQASITMTKQKWAKYTNWLNVMEGLIFDWQLHTLCKVVYQFRPATTIIIDSWIEDIDSAPSSAYNFRIRCTKC